MKKLTIIIALSLLLVITLLLPASCGTDTDTTPGNPDRWLELLKILPRNERTFQAAYFQGIVYMAEKLQQYPQHTTQYSIIHNLPLFGSSPGAYSDAEWKQTLGFVKEDVDITIYAGAVPIDYYEAVRGCFSREDINNAVMTGPMNDMLEVFTYSGYEFYSWGGDNDINFQYRSNVRPLGRGHRLALIDNFIFWVGGTRAMEEMIDSYAGNIESLADSEDYKHLAGGLAELDTVTAFFSTGPKSQSEFMELNKDQLDQLKPEIKERLLGEIEGEPLLKPYQALATGAGIDKKDFYLAIVLLNADEGTARQNKALLEQRIKQAEIVWGSAEGEKWLDYIESMDIGSKGRFTTARLYGKVVEFWDAFEMLGSKGPYEPLLMHE